LYLILDPDLKVCGVLDLDGSKGCKFYNDLRSVKIADDQGKVWLDTLELSVPYGYRETEFMTAGYHLLKQGNDGKYYCYRIYNWEDSPLGPTHVKSVKAINLCIWDLYHRTLHAKKFTNVTSTDAFQYVLQQSGWEIGDQDFLGSSDEIEFTEGQTAQSGLDTLINTFGCEVRAYVEVYNGRVYRKLIDIVEELGESTGRRLEYSHDLVGLTRTGDDTNFFTKLRVYGGMDSTGKQVSIAPANDGKDFIVDDEANDLYNNGGPYLEGYVVNDKILNPNGLLDWGMEQLKKVNHPRYTYEVDVAHLGYKANIGDHIQVVDFSMQPELTISARVIQVDESEANPANTKYYIGEFVEVKVVTPEEVAELADQARQLQQTIEQNKSYKVEYFAPDGTDFGDGNDQKRIIVRVYDGRDEVTSSLDTSVFVWEKINPDGTYDQAWAESHKDVGNVITVGREVIGCTIRCKIDDGDLPSIAVYFQNGIDFVLDELKQIQRPDTLSILFITDTHYSTNSRNNKNLKSRSTLHLQNAAYLTHQTNIDQIIHGGDLIDGDELKKLMMTDLEDAAAALYEYSEAPIIFLVGNHDDNSWYAHDEDGNLMRSVIQPAERYSILSKYLDPDFVQNDAEKELLYGYKDFPAQKIRVICLNSYDNPYITNPDGTNKYPSMWKSAFRQNQLNWLANTALKLPDSSWGVLIFTHAPLKGTFNSDDQVNSDILYGILSAFMSGSTYSGTSSITDYTVNVSCDFRSQGPGELIAVISGHVHYDSSMTKNGILFIQTLDSLARNDFPGKMPDRPLVSLEEDAWDVFTIDRANRKIYATRFGAGSSREFSY
jgi:phage minor structural protein